MIKSLLQALYERSECMKAKTKRTLLDIPIIILAGFIFSCGLETFTAPNNIAPGGASGICVALSHITGLSEGVLYFIVNIPLIVIGFIFLGKKLMFKTLLSIVTITVATDYVFAFLPDYEGDPMLAAIFGGVLIGAGLGLCYTREGTSGGTDIINKLINKKFPHISIGIITFATDFAVIVFAMTVFGKIESALYALIAIFVSSKMIDLLVYGSYEGKMLLIFSEHYSEIADKIIKAGKGVTFLSGKGAYNGTEKQVLCCAVHKHEYVKIKRYVKEIDPAAFMIITSAKEVLGNGFNEIN